MCTLNLTAMLDFASLSMIIIEYDRFAALMCLTAYCLVIRLMTRGCCSLKIALI